MCSIFHRSTGCVLSILCEHNTLHTKPPRSQVHFSLTGCLHNIKNYPHPSSMNHVSSCAGRTTSIPVERLWAYHIVSVPYQYHIHISTFDFFNLFSFSLENDRKLCLPRGKVKCQPFAKTLIFKQIGTV